MVAIGPPVDEQDRDDDCAVPHSRKREKLQAFLITMQHLDVSKTNHLPIFHSRQELQMEIWSKSSKQITLDTWFL